MGVWNNLKVISSFTCEHDILVDFHKQVEPYQRSKLVQSFITKYLAEKKSDSEASIPQSIKSASKDQQGDNYIE